MDIQNDVRLQKVCVLSTVFVLFSRLLDCFPFCIDKPKLCINMQVRSVSKYVNCVPVMCKRHTRKADTICIKANKHNALKRSFLTAEYN